MKNKRSDRRRSLAWFLGLGLSLGFGSASADTNPSAAAGTPAAKEDCDKDAKTRADEKLKAELDAKKQEEKAAEAKALANLGLLNPQKTADKTPVVSGETKMETCK